MNDGYQIRPATPEDAREIAKLIEISSDGVAVIEWQEQAQKEHCDALDIGENTYRQDEGNYSWRNAVVVEKNREVAGMLLAFGMPDGPIRDTTNRPSNDAKNVFAPYIYLEEPNSWYICGIAFYPEHRGQGLGSQLMQLAEEQAKQHGFKKLSLVAFEQNEGSVRLYRRLGYEVVDEAPVIAHPLIHYSGKALLMVKMIN